MRSNLLLLGMAIPIALAIAYYAGERGAAPEAVDRLSVQRGARVATGDLEGLLAGAGPDGRPIERSPAAASAQASLPRVGWLDELRGWLPGREANPPLLVILVEGKSKVAVARNGVRDERISGETEEAFVVDGDRMVAASRDAAAALIATLDWVDRPIQLVAAAARKTPVAPRTRRRDPRAAAAVPFDSIAAEAAAVRRADRARVESAIGILRNP